MLPAITPSSTRRPSIASISGVGKGEIFSSTGVTGIELPEEMDDAVMAEASDGATDVDDDLQVDAAASDEAADAEDPTEDISDAPDEVLSI